MAVSTRMAAPNYKIYEPDALDAIYAKGNLDPIMGGISYAFGQAKRQNTAMDQEEFMRQQAQYNKMAAALDAMEIDAKTKTEAMKIGGDLILKGEDPTKVLAGDSIYKNSGDSLLPGMLRNKIAADTAASGSRSSGDGLDTVTVKETTVPAGENRTVETTRKMKVGKDTGPTVPPAGTAANPKAVTSSVQNNNTVEQRAARIAAALGTKDVNQLQVAPDPKNPGRAVVTNKATGVSKSFDLSTGNETR